MSDAWIDGNAVTLSAAAIEAAQLLQASRFPVIAGRCCGISMSRVKPA
jgi:hypothetical protein